MITGFKTALSGIDHEVRPPPRHGDLGQGHRQRLCFLRADRHQRRDGAWRDPRAGQEKVFLISTTHGAETHAMAAVLATIDGVPEPRTSSRTTTRSAAGWSMPAIARWPTADSPRSFEVVRVRMDGRLRVSQSGRRGVPGHAHAVHAGDDQAGRAVSGRVRAVLLTYRRRRRAVCRPRSDESLPVYQRAAGRTATRSSSWASRPSPCSGRCCSA